MQRLASAVRATLMTGSILALGLTAAATARAQSGQPDSADAVYAVDEENPAPRVVAKDGVEVVLFPLSRGEDNGYTVLTVVRADEREPAVIEAEVYRLAYGPKVTIGKLSASDALPSVMVQTYTGGAHCCTDVTILTPGGEEFQTVEVGSFNGGPAETFPEDIDGDGTVDIAVQDDRFLYAFAPYAGSMAPPLFLNVIDGKVVDVTLRPGFRNELKAFSAEAKAACTDPENSFPNGACAAYVAVEAQMGKMEQALASVKRHINHKETSFLPIGCRIETPTGVCPEDQEIQFTSFEPALRWFLKHLGYDR